MPNTAECEFNAEEFLKVLKAFRGGDFKVRMRTDAAGVEAEIAEALNEILEYEDALADEYVRAAAALGREGRMNQRLSLQGGEGGWKRNLDHLNGLIAALVQPLTDVSRVIGAVAKGDLTQSMALLVDGEPLKGEYLRTARAVNGMVHQLKEFASEVTRVAREVGTEGKLGGQAVVKGVGGVWADLTSNVNLMASNLTAQVRNIAEVTTAVANGDLGKQITVEVQGEILQLKDTINTMVDQLGSFASEVTRVAREVGTDGKLGGQAVVKGVGGVWADLTESVNHMANNLTTQVRNIAEVTTAVANGNLSKRITVDVRGEILELKRTINTMVDQLGSFAAEVTRVAREVGTEGKLGGQAMVSGVAGTWKDLTDNVNAMAGNLTIQLRDVSNVATAIAGGDLSRKVTASVKGEILQIKETINTMVDQLNAFAGEVTRVAREVGTDGKLGGQAVVRGTSGTWKNLTDNVNFMASNLTDQVRNIAEVASAIACGDLSKKITVEARGEIQELKDTLNTMVDQLNAFASEVTRVAWEVGTEGKLGGQAYVKGVAGTWKNLTDNVNFMAAHLTTLTTQVRSIAKIMTAVAMGDLKRKLVFEARGEMAELAETINSMIDTLATFGDQVANVAREVGIEGRLGGQARVPGAAGLWRDLTDNVNQLAGNLTTQVRAIAEVATAVTAGNLSRSITVQAAGEVAALKDNINEMIGNLRETTNRGAEQDWMKTNLTKFTRMLQGQRDFLSVANRVLAEVAPLVSAQQGAFYMAEGEGDGLCLRLMGGYALAGRQDGAVPIRRGEGLVGQAAAGKARMVITHVPAEHARIETALIKAAPRELVVLPVLFEGEVKAVLELASLGRFSEVHLALLDELATGIGIVLNTIAATMRTEELLKQSQALTEELRCRQGELTKTNQRLETQASTLQRSQQLLEKQKAEVEQARTSLQEKAEQLAMTSRFKSEFLANMSHELRTPLNCLLILSKALEENPDGNLAPRQVEFASTIHAAGNDLLALINDVLDLAKIESGTLTIACQDVPFPDILQFAERTFRPLAEAKGTAFVTQLDPELPPALYTDPIRLQQVIRNLLSNAFKFTEQGRVELLIRPARSGWDPRNQRLATGAVAFTVKDTGIGIDPAKQGVIFEAFQQADGTTSRKFGGTGLGLSISREIAKVFGGEISLQSAPGRGSTFTLFLPLEGPAAAPAAENRQAQPAGPPVKAGRPDRTLIVTAGPDLGKRIADLAQARGFRTQAALGEAQAFHLIHTTQPAALILDPAEAPDGQGWALLDRLKHEAATRCLPVGVLAAGAERKRAARLGARACLAEPALPGALEAFCDRLQGFAERPVRRLLLALGDDARVQAVRECLGDQGLETATARTGAEALAALAVGEFDCMVVDRVPDLSAADLLERIWAASPERELPVVLHGDPPEEAALADGGFTVRTVRSPQELVAAVSFFLHRPWAALPPATLKLMEQARLPDPLLAGRSILIVDDDPRNVFSLMVLLEKQAMRLHSAAGGREALALLESVAADLVLLDLMMPDMDGYETLAAIRSLDSSRDFPVVALTAKAMKEDREKALAAGASAYLTKPVDPEHLLSTLRIHLRS